MAYQISRVKGLRSIPLCVKFMPPKTDLGVEIWGTYISNNQMDHSCYSINVDPDPRSVGPVSSSYNLGYPTTQL